ncbi:MAG: dihydrofolate reductase family protein [Acidimicrobiales bacterium]
MASAAVQPPPEPASRWVTANMVAGLSNDADRALFRALRAEADVVLVGAGTVRAERYGPVTLTPAQTDARVDAGRAPQPPIAVVTRSLQLDWSLPLFASSGPGPGRPLVITCSAGGAAAIETASEHAEVVVVGDRSVDLAAALDELERRGFRRVLTEGGPALLGELVSLGLLDELRLTLAPVIGGDPLPIASHPAGPAGRRALTTFDLADLRQEDGHLFLRYLTRKADHA